MKVRKVKNKRNREEARVLRVWQSLSNSLHHSNLLPAVTRGGKGIKVQISKDHLRSRQPNLSQSTAKTNNLLKRIRRVKTTATLTLSNSNKNNL